MRKKIKHGGARKLLLYALCLALGSTVAGFALFFYLAKTLPSVEQLSSRSVSQSTKIYDRSGSVLLYEVSGDERRTVVPLGEMPQYLKDAVISIEDERFYESPAFDWKGIARAVFVNITRGKILAGGSTITQQLARNAFLTAERTLTRKIKELILAVRLDGRYSKNQILELYLNQVSFGPALYGVEVAGEAYFNKSARDLTLAESALLAAMPKAPTYYSPWGSHVKELLARQKTVLQKMFDLGKITKKELDGALAEKLMFAPQRRGLRAPHFVMAVQDYLVQKYGEDLIQKGGLRVITTLNWDLQQLAEKVVAAGATENEKLYKGKNAALVAEDAVSGQILALVGSRDYFDLKNEGNFDVATQGLRQPGSALKPFVYLTAFQKGYTPETVLFDVPTEFAANNPDCPPAPDFSARGGSASGGTNESQECFHPENFDDRFRGPVSLRQALSQSINVPAVKTLYLAGLKDSLKNANAFGLNTLTSPSLYGLSLVLGGGAIKLIDLVGAYSVLSQDGVKHARSLVLEIKDARGAALESFKDSAARVADPEPVRLINNILSDADARSGLFQNSLGLTIFPEHDVALKTGTSNDYRDAWAIGYTPSLAVGVWAGNNDNAPMQKHGSSILAAIPIWNAFMVEALRTRPSETFTRPEPPTPAKPIFAGDYLPSRQLHSILYYVDKDDPAGPAPLDPADDPQFTNWETGVLAWAKNNLPEFESYNLPAQAGQPVVFDPRSSLPGAEQGTGALFFSASPPQVLIEAPAAGSFAGNRIDLVAKISGPALSKARIFLNGSFVQEVAISSGASSHDLRLSFSPQNLAPQNLLEVEAITENNLSSKSGVIVYWE